jgi:hypothetical protein
VRACAQVAGLTAGPDCDGHFRQLLCRFLQALAAKVQLGADAAAIRLVGGPAAREIVRGAAPFLIALYKVRCCCCCLDSAMRCMWRRPYAERTCACEQGLQGEGERRVVCEA